MSKYNTTIRGCSGQVVIGDHSTIYAGDQPRRVQQEIFPTQEERPPATASSQSDIHCQESTGAEFDDFPSLKIKSGYVLIINNQEFHQRPQVERTGSEQDVSNLRSMFDDFGLQPVKVERNLSSTKMLELLEETSEKDFSKYDCFICVILSHGSASGVLGTDEQAIQIESLTHKFRRSSCPTLVGKPKIFIIQACRGSSQELLSVESDSEPVPIHCRGLPSDAEFLICFASSPGYESYRSPELGSWFVKSIVEVFKKYASSEHLMDMMLRVNYQVASYHSNKGHKQMPSEVCMLTKKVYFNV